MKKIYLALALHFHQPTGNFDNIFKRAHDFCYKPFLELLAAYPDIKMMFHFSGCLMDYLEKNHPETITLVKKMVSSGQIELMGGGYYEPILTAIPERDIKGQIAMLSEYYKHNFGLTPKGMWLAERVWHPSLVKPIYDSGIRYLILDDEHFLRSGLDRENIHGYFLTGHGKEKLAVFPSDKKLRYLIPFREVQETLNYLKSTAEWEENLLLTYGDDGEKFGEWPGTHKWVFDEKWLDKFFKALEENKEWVKSVHFSNYIKHHKPNATLTIHEGSYQEMMEWSGGSWLNFLSKYPESNQMYKKMHYVSSKIEALEKEKREPAKTKISKRELYMGQCNCGYWHGVFGGLYLYHLRQAIYNHLIKADKLADEILHKGKKGWIEIRSFDFDKDGHDEVVIESSDLTLVIDPHDGAVVKELDFRPLSINLVNGLSRKKEAYHQKILESAEPPAESKVSTIHDDFKPLDPSLKEMLFYDKFERSFLRAYFLKNDAKLEEFVAASYEEVGSFSSGAYAFHKKDKRVILSRLSRVRGAEVLLRKEIRLESENKIAFFFSVHNKGDEKLNSVLGIEFNLTMPYLNADRYSYSVDGEDNGNLNSQGYSFPATSFGIADAEGELGIALCFSKKPASVLYFPVKTISQSERAYELNYQCSSVVVLHDIVLKKGEEYAFDIGFAIEKA